VERDTLLRLAEAQGFDPAAYAAALDSAKPAAHIAQTQTLMRRLGVGGFPSVFVETQGEVRELSPQNYFKNPDGFVNAIRTSGRKTLH
jgi:protein-disulfide isomerase-like protein with CxxC motif